MNTDTDTENTETIEAPRARLARLRQEREAREAEAAVAVAAERDANECEALEALAKAESQYGSDAVTIEDDGHTGFVVLRRPPVPNWKKFSAIEKPDQSDFERLIRPCVVFASGGRPTPIENFEVLTNTRQGFILTAANAVCRLAGVNRKKLEGK